MAPALRCARRMQRQEASMAKAAAIIVSKRVRALTAGLICLSLAQFVLASCEPDEFAPVGARTAHAAR
jgi:hypothetical protein